MIGAAEWDGPEAIEVIRQSLETPSGAAPQAGSKDDVPGPRSEAPPAARRFVVGDPARTALPSSFWKDHLMRLKEKGHEHA